MLIQLNPGKVADKPLRNILGMNNISRSGTRAKLERDIPRFEALRLGHIRFHDAPIDNAPQRLVDISAIFPLFHLDETKEENYYFTQTDDYMQSIVHTSAEIDFRLGETIDHSEFFRLIQVPADIDKWARICRNVIGHYKNGEMHGMHLNIKRVSVWEEPDNPKLLGGTVEQYAEMFCKVYRVIKKDFPHIMVGGPTAMRRSRDFLDRFLTLCLREGITPDFISGTYYCRSVDVLREQLEAALAVVDAHGLTDSKYVLAEWHYGLRDWDRYSYVREHGFQDAESAAYSTSALMEMMDMDRIDVAYYYSWSTHNWAIFNCHEGNDPLMPVYYGLSFFQQLAVDCAERVSVTVDGSNGARVLAGKTPEGKLRLLVSCHECPAAPVEILGAEKATACLKRITQDYSETLCTDGEPIAAQDGVFHICHPGGSAVYLLEFDA